MAAFRRDVANFSPSGGLLMALSDAEQHDLMAKVNAIYSWIRGGDPKVDNIFQLWAADRSQSAALADIKALLQQALTATGVVAPGQSVPDLDALAEAVAEKAAEKIAARLAS